MGSSYEVVKDPIHGYIKIFDHEKKIIDTSIFQRLRRVKQNTAVDYAYPCATHSRFSHSLGVMHIAGLFAERILDQIPRVSELTKKRYFYFMRLWGLTHDIGHGPFSHTFDDVVLRDHFRTDHERLGAKILLESDELPRTARPEGNIEIVLDEIAPLLEVKSMVEWPINGRIGGSSVKETVLYYICRGAYSADIMDFLLRDSYFTGAGYGNIDWKRLIFLSVPMKDRLILDPRGEEAFDSLLLARLFMFNAVYYHRTTRAAVKVISDFLKEAISKIDFNQFVRDVNCYSNLDENFLLYHQSLLDSVYRNQLIERKIPYTRFEEQSRLIDIGVSDKDLADILTRNTRSKLSSDLRDTPDKAFFIDTPTFRLNPQFGQQEDFIFLADPRETRGYRPRRVLETTWGSLRKKMFLLRLYIHDDYKEYADKIVDSFWSRPAETHV